ncbi:MAG: PEP-CTERM sorting domain-containing protein [Pirellulales bacterium]|nr:PEP-CTERM sorting domain-containing protein [Pirellulales bacterium]
MIRFHTLCVALVLVVAATTVHAEMIVNGNFEDLTGWGLPGTADTPANWTPNLDEGRKNPALQQSGVNAIGGSGTSAFMGADNGASGSDRRDMWQVDESNPIGPQWVVEFDFATEDPGVEGDRSLSGSVEVTNGNRITMRVTDVDDDGIGDFQIYDKSTNTTGIWRPILANAVEFDDDVSTTPVVNHITFTGHFDEAAPVYDITITNGLPGGVFTATGVGYFAYTLSTKPATGVEGVNFNTFISKGDYLLDNVSVDVPEPGAISLLLTGFVCLAGTLVRRRHG